MNYHTITPLSPLAEYVRFFWVLESDVISGEHYVHRSMADGCAELIFHYNGRFEDVTNPHKTERSFSSGIHGQSKRHSRFRIDQSFGIFGVYLYPYALPTLFNIPASEITDAMPDLHTLLGREGSELEDKMMLATGNDDRIRIISSFLQARLIMGKNKSHRLHSAISTIIGVRGQADIKTLADQYCLSGRQFERKFRELSGFSPKLYCRITRFQSVFKELNAGKRRLSEIAHRCGYYDQAHFIHDFKEFSGYTPKQFLLDDSSESVIWSE